MPSRSHDVVDPSQLNYPRAKLHDAGTELDDAGPENAVMLAYENRQQELKIQKQAAIVASLKQDIGERKKYALFAFVMTAIWLGMILHFFYLTGISKMSVSDTIWVTLLGTTTVKVVGIIYLVMRYLFNSSDNNP